MVHILRLQCCFEVFLDDSSEVILQLGATEVGKNGLPLWQVIELAKVGLELPRKDLQCCGFSNPICTHKPQNLQDSVAWFGSGPRESVLLCPSGTCKRASDKRKTHML